MQSNGRRAINVVYTRNSKQWSRMELLDWINKLLECEVKKIDDLCTGAAYCNLMDILFKDVVRMNKVKFVCNQVVEYIENFRVLQQSFNAVSVNTPLDIEQLVKGRFQENYAFALWFRLFFEQNFREMPAGYNPRAARGYLPIAIGQASLPAAVHARTTSPHKKAETVDEVPQRHFVRSHTSPSRGGVYGATAGPVNRGVALADSAQPAVNTDIEDKPSAVKSDQVEMDQLPLESDGPLLVPQIKKLPYLILPITDGLPEHKTIISYAPKAEQKDDDRKPSSSPSTSQQPSSSNVIFRIFEMFMSRWKPDADKCETEATCDDTAK